MTNAILHIACAASILTRRDTWDAFNWNRTEVGLREALAVLVEDTGGLTEDLIGAKDAYFEEWR